MLTIIRRRCMARKLAAAVFTLGCIHASSSFALGLGEIKLNSFLNEPLRAQVELLNTEELHSEEIRIRLATREDFERMGVERAYFLTSISFDVSVDDRGQGIISITSEDPVLEPFLDFIVEARWPSGRLLREYTVLVDPPLFDSSTPVVSATQRVSEVEGTPLPGSAEKKSTDPAAASGTRVDVRNSDLAPGAMPQRDFNADTAATPRAGARYMIHRDDTLWQIASAARPDGTSVHQTMLDIQRLNPDAFIDGNINRIKAGYIIYLPEEGDISSQDLASALAEVKQQNEDWRAGIASAPVASGPKLRISADPAEGEVDAAGAGVAADGTGEDSVDSARAREMAQELASAQQQVDTLQRIVNLKDDQIAALQNALEEAGASVEDVDAATDTAEQPIAAPDDEEGALDSEAFTTSVEGEDGLMASDDAADALAEDDVVAAADEAPADELAPEVATGIEAEAEAEAASAPTVPPAVTPPESQGGGLMSTLLYGAGALLLAALAFFFVRKRREGQDSEPALEEDAFADVQLKEETVERVPETPVAEPVEEEFEEPLEDAEPVAEAHGYGEHKHDEYASDVDTSDALAEADIYIAYGRYPQAKDLLLGALANEPENPAYRLKLLETELQMGDTLGAENQLRELEAIGDQNSIARARELLGEGESFNEPPAGLGDEIDSLQESDFTSLEIEGGVADDGILDEDLDLSADFADDALGGNVEEEDLVIAAEANGMSTKLDLARAYMDMGDEDGARQILEEVAAEGSEEQKAEAGELLERIG